MNSTIKRKNEARKILLDFYTPISQIKKELEIRRNNPDLIKKVSEFIYDKSILHLFKDSLRAVISRPVATPNVELDYFIDIANHLEMKPLVLEYPDKFVSRNTDKYHLCKMFFNFIKGSRSITRKTVNIVNFNNCEGKYMKDINTIFGNKILDFHHDILFKAHPGFKKNIFDFTDWFKNSRKINKHYYTQYLALFLVHGVLFENFFIDDEDEMKFLEEKFVPSAREIERIFGIKPLIFPIIPFEYERDLHWLSYSEDVEKIFNLLNTK